MHITILGASGRAGSEITRELALRGHQITGIARHPERIPVGERIVAIAGDVSRPDTLAGPLAGADVVISAVMFTDGDPELLIGAVKASGAPRYLVVGGAGSLEVAPGVRLIDTPEFPEIYRAEAAAGGRFLDRLRLEPELNWTFLSPSIVFEGSERRGAFRLGGDQVLFDAAGNSAISFPDYAIAMADEVEAPRHPRARFTVGY